MNSLQFGIWGKENERKIKTLDLVEGFSFSFSNSPLFAAGKFRLHLALQTFFQVGFALTGFHQDAGLIDASLEAT
jgi:hypothetical protein